MSAQRIENLAQAFEVFNRTTEELKTAYDNLALQVRKLNRQLEDTNRELEAKVNELGRVKNYLNDILESMTDGVVAVDLEGRITAFNRAAAKITGFNPDEVIGTPYAEVCGQNFWPVVSSKQEMIDEASGGRCAAEIPRRDGSVAPVSMSTALLRDSAGKTLGAVRVFQDLSEVTQLREEVHRSERLAALGQMAATVAHEIRNPLGAIEGFASLLARDFEDADPRRKLVEKIHAGTRSLNRVVTELLTFTRPMKFFFAPLDCQTLFESALAYLDREAKEREIKLERIYPKNPPKTKGDSEKLRQALLNIGLNAVQSVEIGGIVKAGIVEGYAAGENGNSFARLFIEDNGCGIEEKDMQNIFNPFFTTKEKGTGLGLAVALKIVESHGGRIEVNSEPGRGSRFEVLLPVVG